MINPKIIKTGAAVLSALQPFVFAIIGGFVVTKCESKQPVNLIVTNQQYESEISEIRAKQDTLNRVLPGIVESQRYMSEKYGKPGVRAGD